MNCRICNNNLNHEFIDLGYAPVSNSYLEKQQLNHPEVLSIKNICVCDCWLFQTRIFCRQRISLNKIILIFPAPLRVGWNMQKSFVMKYLKH